jgi:hypothetical protein
VLLSVLINTNAISGMVFRMLTVLFQPRLILMMVACRAPTLALRRTGPPLEHNKVTFRLNVLRFRRLCLKKSLQSVLTIVRQRTSLNFILQGTLIRLMEVHLVTTTALLSCDDFYLN